MGIPFLEYSCMPVAELSDLIDFYMASEGLVTLSEIKDESFFPGGVR